MPDTALSRPRRPAQDAAGGGEGPPATALVLAEDPVVGGAIRAALTECGAELRTGLQSSDELVPQVCCVALVCNDVYGARDPYQRLPREHVLDVARAMARRGTGRLVLVTDGAAQVHTGGSAQRAAARAADLAWWRHLAASVAADGLTANTVAVGYAPFLGHALPAGVEAELLRHLVIRRPAEPADLAGALGLLISPGSSYLVGETIALDGGMDLNFIPPPRPGGSAGVRTAVRTPARPTARPTTQDTATSLTARPAPPPRDEPPVTLVVGASSGIGRASARLLASQGSDIVLAARRRAELEEVAAQVAGFGRRAWVIPCDAADGDAIAALADTAWRAAGRVDRLLYAAGHLEFGAARTGTDAWDQTFAVNLGGYSTLSSALVRRWIDAGTPAVIAAVASVGSTSVPVTRVEAYGASKAAMTQYSRCLAASTARHRIRVNCVCPGIIETPMGEAAGPDFRDGWLSRIPAGRVGKPMEVAAVLGYLLSPASAYVTGARLRVDGGYGLGGLPPLSRRDGILTYDAESAPGARPGEAW